MFFKCYVFQESFSEYNEIIRNKKKKRDATLQNRVLTVISTLTSFNRVCKDSLPNALHKKHKTFFHAYKSWWDAYQKYLNQSFTLVIHELQTAVRYSRKLNVDWSFWKYTCLTWHTGKASIRLNPEWHCRLSFRRTSE